MPKQKEYRLPERKEPGLIGKLLSVIVQSIVWLFISLIISIVIEWIGITWFWPDQGADHAKLVLENDLGHLNQDLYNESISAKKFIIEKTKETIVWMQEQNGIRYFLDRASEESSGLGSALRKWVSNLHQKYLDYFLASGYVAQIFVVRIALIIFSLPTFVIAAFAGAADGLVERDLRRWGGGRESSNIFSIARRSVVPIFVSACVIYVSLPYSLNPAIVMLPFSLLLGITFRISFERLKKYF